MKPANLKLKTLSALVTLIFSQTVLLSRPVSARTETPELNSPDAYGFLNSYDPALPTPYPAPVPVKYGEPDSDYDFDEDDQDDTESKSSVRLDGDGSITLLNSKTLETISIQYRDAAGNYIPKAAAAIRHFFRCRLTGEEHDIAPGVLEIIDSLQEKFKDRPVTLLSGYRSPKLNAALSRGNSHVSKRSLHMSGMAADISIPGVSLKALRSAALALQKHKTGGVGYYPTNGFVHVDTGRVRSWTDKARVIKHKRVTRAHARPKQVKRTRRAK